MFLRPAEAAALAGLSTRAIYCAIGRRELRACACARGYASRRDGFEAWVASSAVRVKRPMWLSRRPPRRWCAAVPPAVRRRVAVVSVERVVHKDGTVVWRVRWRQGGRNRSKVLGSKRDVEAFDADITRRKRAGELAQLEAGEEPLAQFGGAVVAVRRAEPLTVDAQGLRLDLGRARAPSAGLGPVERADTGRRQQVPPRAGGRRRGARRRFASR